MNAKNFPIRVNLSNLWLKTHKENTIYCKYYSQGIVVFLASNWHFDSKLLTDYYLQGLEGLQGLKI